MSHEEPMYVTHCCDCGILFAMTQDLKDRRKKEGGSFYCPNGHEQIFRETEVERQRKTIEQLERRAQEANDRAERYRRRAEVTERRRISAKAHFTRLKNKYAPPVNVPVAGGGE